MPRGNGTGPTGLGPMSGRGAGFCAGYDVPGYANPTIGGRGFYGAGGMGMGRGFRNRYYATGLPGWQRGGRGVPLYPAYPAYQPSPGQQLDALKSQAKVMEEDLARTREMISEIEANDDQSKK